MQQLEAEAVQEAKDRFNPPKMWAGDAVEVKVRGERRHCSLRVR